MQYNRVWHIKSIYPTKFQVNTVTNIEVIWENVLSHAIAMVNGVSSDLKGIWDTWIIFRDIGILCFLNFGDICHIYFRDMDYFPKKINRYGILPPPSRASFV